MEDESQPSRSLRLIAAENVSAPRVVPTREGYDLWAQIYDAAPYSHLIMSCRSTPHE
jgi:hypothetical protein